MADNGLAPIIVIKKVKKVAGGHHGGAWKVAYADFVTAMMAFFLVMWILGLSKPVRMAIASYFNDPVGFMKMAQGGKSPVSGGEKVNIGENKPAHIIPRDGGVSLLMAQFKAVAAAIEQQLRQGPKFSGILDSVKITVTDEGLRIELMEKRASMFFDTGSARLKPRTVEVLQVIAKQLATLKNPVVLEGHTDSRPLNGPNDYTNWELSTDRANSARRAMETHGLRKGQVIAVRGYADRKLLRPDDPLHFSNRRVSILVPYSVQGQ